MEKLILNYQYKTLKFAEQVFACPHFQYGGDCKSELADVSESLYKHGPEMTFVGEKYGQPNIPRILFTRLNPTWNNKIGWFGTNESVIEYRKAHPSSETKEFFVQYLKGWENGSKIFRGMQDAGTITGHSNQSHLADDKKRSNPRYGIQIILEEMVRAGIFPESTGSPLDFCAINNVIKCASSRSSWNPSTSMYRNCNYYERELYFLVPHIIIAFGNKTDDYLRSKLHSSFTATSNPPNIRLSNGELCLYYKFPHPLGLGKNTWKGDDIQNLRTFPELFREIGPKEKEQFRAGPKKKSTEILFRYVLHLVGQIMEIKKNLC